MPNELWTQTTPKRDGELYLPDPYSKPWQMTLADMRAGIKGGAYRSLISVSEYGDGWESGDAAWVSRHHPDWILHDEEGRPVRWSDKQFRENGSVNPDFFRYYLDMTAGPALWEWIAMQYARVARTRGCTSFSLDNVALGEQRMRGLVTDLDAWNKALIGCLTVLWDVGEQLGFEVYANTNLNYGAHHDSQWLKLAGSAVDGLMTEQPLGADNTAEQWQTAMDWHERLLYEGSADLWCVHCKDETDESLFFKFASWLLLDGDDKVFVVNQGYGEQAYVPDWLSLVHVLEKPVDEREKDGGVWQREFEHGIVVVNPDVALKAYPVRDGPWRIQSHEVQWRVRGEVLLPAKSAVVLVCPGAWYAHQHYLKRAEARGE
jgi:hypothetical protein